MIRSLVVLAVIGLAVLARPLRAQSATELLERGVSEYRALEYDAAVLSFRRALATTGRSALADSIRAGAWVYLGAAELLRGRADAAEEAFRSAVVADPRHRADELIFPPDVTQAFDRARRRHAAVLVVAPADTAIPLQGGTYRVRLHGSTPHDVRVEIELADGTIARDLYDGRMSDSLDVGWDGKGADERTPIEGSATLRIASRLNGTLQRTTLLPITVSVSRVDTLPWPAAPADSVFLPEQERDWRPFGSLVTGVVAGIAVAALPSLVASDGKGYSARYLVGGVIGLTGILGYLRGAETRPVATNVAANQARRNDWRRQVDFVRNENERRRREGRISITAHRVTIATGRVPR